MTVLPPAPNWFSAQILRCSGDGHLAYGARHAVVVVRCQPQTHFVNHSEDPDSDRDVGSEGKNWRRSSPSPTGGGGALSPAERVPPAVHINGTAFSGKAKITALCWSPDSSLLAATSDDGHVRILKVDDDGKTMSTTCTQMHTLHRDIGKDRHKVNTVSWSRPDPDLLVSGDELGNLVVWDVKTNTTRGVNVGKNNVFVLETHPYSADIVAFGCRLGLAFVVNISGNGKVLQKIRGHDEDIQGLSWCPSKFREVFGEHRDTTKEESLLALSSRDKTITIWSAQTGGQLAQIRLPGGPGSKAKQQDAKMSWTTCFWWKTNIILSSGVHGELLEWNLDKITKQSADGIMRADGPSEVQYLHKEHARTLYSIHTTGASIQSSGQDRAIVSYHWSSRSLDFNLPAFAAWVYTIAPNCRDPSVIAMGAGDAQIRVWKMKSNKALFDVNTIWQKLNSAKVTALAWHPDKENILAFGTEEGRVGLLDAFSTNRSFPTFCDFKHRGQVYNLCFGPQVCSKQTNGLAYSSSGDHKDVNCKKMLFSIGDGHVMMHNTKNDGSKTINVDDVIAETNRLSRKAPNRSDMMFQPYEYKFMVIGCDDGLIEVCSVPRLEILFSLKSFHKLVQSLAWHPTYTGSSENPSPFKYWLATASNEPDIHVWDLTSQLELVSTTASNACLNTSDTAENLNSSLNTEKGDAGIITSPILPNPTLVLSGHHSRVIYLNWSPHEDAKLISVSYDCTAQVWDAKNGTPICNFSGHSERLFCGVWSPIDPDVVFTGGEDSTVMGWRISEQPDKLPSKKPSLKKLNAKSRAKEAKDAFGHGESNNDALTMLEAKRRELMMEASLSQSNNSNESPLTEGREAVQQDPRGLGAKRRQKKRAYFPVSLAQENNSKGVAWDDCERLYEFLYGEENSGASSPSSEASQKPCLDDKIHLGFFADRFSMDNLIDVEKRHLKEQGYDDAVAHLSLWCGDIGEAIKAGIASGKLNDWLVSMAAGVSYSLWKEACNAYAAQLIKEDDVIKGASYYLMTHNVEKAIEELRNHHFYRAAISIAKIQMPEKVPLLQELYTAWGLQSSNDGSYELAAKCWIAAGEHSQAACLLAKRPDASSMRVAASLALKAKEYDRYRTLATQCINLCSKTKNDKCLERIIAQNDQSESSSPIWTEIQKVKKQAWLALQDIRNQTPSSKDALAAAPAPTTTSNSNLDHDDRVSNDSSSCAISQDGTNEGPEESNQ